MNTTDPKEKKEGFTLVETMIALVILAVGLGACAITFNMAMMSVRNNQNRMSALHFAREELERLRTLSFTDGALALGNHDITNTEYLGSYAVTSVNPDLVNISLSIQWDNAMRGSTVTEVLTTSIARPLH